MKKTIADVMNIPNGDQPMRFTACFVSMLMRAEGMASSAKLHQALYDLYSAVTGFSFLQADLSSSDYSQKYWNQTSNVLLREFDWYIGFAMDYAGYESEELIFPSEQKKNLTFAKIKASIDQDIPVLALFGRVYQWVLVTGYDENATLYGLDGAQSWGEPDAASAGYDENGLFIMPDWYEKAGHAFVLGAKKEPTVTMRDVCKRGTRIMEYGKEIKL